MSNPVTSPVPAPTVRISGRAGIVAAIPPILGFVPRESLVVLGLRGPSARVGPVVRGDIGPAELTVPPLVRHARNHADEAVVVCFHDGPRPPCLDALIAGLRAAQVPVVAALSVHDGRVMDSSTAATYATDAGTPLEAGEREGLALRTAAALSGRRVLESRDELVASVAGPEKAARAASAAAIAAARAALSVESVDPFLVTAQQMTDADTALEAALTEFAGSGGVTVETAAGLAALCDHRGCRDYVLGRAIQAADSDMLGMLAACARQILDRDATAICCVLAAAAYRGSSGALAHCALDRAERNKPIARLVHLLRAFVDSGLPPHELDHLAEATLRPLMAHRARPHRAEQHRQRPGQLS